MNFVKPQLFHGLFLGVGSLFVICMAGRTIALDNSGALNNALGIITTDKGDSDVTYFQRTYTSNEEVKKAFKEAAKQVENDGLVLLKNENQALPLTQGSEVSLFGTASARFNYNTSGSSETNSSNYITLKSALSNVGFHVNQDLLDLYASEEFKQYGRKMQTETLYVINEAPWSAYQNSLANVKGTAIVTLARDSGEGKDLSTQRSDGEDGSYLSLSEAELSVLTGLTELKNQHKIDKIVVLLNTSNPIEQDYLFRDGINVDALMWVGNVGSYGLEAVAEVLKGSNPSGRLSDTYCRDNFSSPAMASWALNNNKSFGVPYSNYNKVKSSLNETNRVYGVYNEGVYVGYRYYETRYEDVVLNRGNTSDYVYSDDVAFPFGFGLSYTTFSYSNFNVTASSDGLSFDVSLTVKNTGNVAGRHSVMVYMQRAYSDYDQQHQLEKPAVELAGFTKTKELQANEEETVHIKINKSQFKTYDNDGFKTYILEKGDYYLTVGKDAHHAINNILMSKNGVDTSKMSGMAGESSLTYKYQVAETDSVTYSVSEYDSSVTITNQLDHADMNRYEGKGENSVTYTSRKDWSSTYPKEKISIEATEQMLVDLQSHKELPSDGKMPTYNSGTKKNVASLIGKDFDDQGWDELLDSMTKEDQIKLVTDGQLTTTTLAAVGLPATIHADGPTAVTKTTTDSAFPSEGIWASTFDLELIGKVGDAFAEDILNCHVEGIYAPGVNIHRTPFIGRSNEYFSEDPLLTGLAAASEIKALQAKGVITHVKHYAFNDCETYRNGISIWLNEQEAREILLLPFELAVTEGKTGALMSSFNRAGCVWTGADQNLSINILQKEWDFKGYAITDMAVSNGGTYMVYDDGFMGGTNLFMASANTLDKYKNNAAFCSKVRDSAHRILYTIANQSFAMNGLDADTEVHYITPWWENTINILCIATGILTLYAFVLVIYCMFVTRETN